MQEQTALVRRAAMPPPPAPAADREIYDDGVEAAVEKSLR